jgi:hypothetical protein
VTEEKLIQQLLQKTSSEKSILINKPQEKLTTPLPEKEEVYLQLED